MTIALPPRPLLLGLLLASSGWTWAQDFGLQAGLSVAEGPFRQSVSSFPALTLGIHELLDQGQGTAFRVRFDGLWLQGRNATVPGAEPGAPALRNRLTSLMAGVDSMHFFEGSPLEGVYLYGGLGAASNRLLSSSAGPADSAGSWPMAGDFRASCTRLYYALGLGYQIRPQLGAEIRWVKTSWSGGGVNLRPSTITLAVTHRFP